ncbi:hypothetical protein C8J57DRAFT_1653164 [Mycena rebaudengoi]|nr:hypothetical protein C8J57DRAFT_1653164 [Mycena rebaudengoi]
MSSSASHFQRFFDNLLRPQNSAKTFLELSVPPDEWSEVKRILASVRDADIIRFRISYAPDTNKCIIYCMPSPAHECASRNFIASLTLIMYQQLPGNMGRDFALGGSQRTDISNTGHASIKEPDECIYPDRPPGPNCCWPNIVIETGVSETHTQLKNDMYRWFAADRAVKLVILIIIDIKSIPTDSSILVELWEPDLDFIPGPARQAAHRTRVASRREYLVLTDDLVGKSLNIMFTDLFDVVPQATLDQIPATHPDRLVMGQSDLERWRDRILRAMYCCRRLSRSISKD